MDQKHEVPEEHSNVVGGSIAARRIGCPRSYTLEKMVPADPGNAYTREGTALHEMIAVVLKTDKEPSELLPFTFKREANDTEGAWEFTVTEDLWYDIGESALQAFDQFVKEIEAETGATFEYVIETRCQMPGIPNAFGTADVIWTCGDMSGVWDWKFGRNRVSAEENDQLMFYGRAAVSTMPNMFGATSYSEVDHGREVILSIMQPQVDERPSEYIVTVEELEGFRKRLVAAVKSATEQGIKAPVAKGKWCDYATCKAVCPLWAGQTATFGEKMSKLADLAKAQKVDSPAKVTARNAETGEVVNPFDAMLPDLLDLADAAEGWIKQVREAAFTLLEAGAPIEGWRIGVSTTSRRAWGVDEEAVRKFFKNRRYTLDDYMPRQLITMPAAEKLLKRDDRVVPEDMIDKKLSTKNALVREDSSLPAPAMSTERAKVLGGKLAALTGGTTEA